MGDVYLLIAVYTSSTVYRTLHLAWWERWKTRPKQIKYWRGTVSTTVKTNELLSINTYISILTDTKKPILFLSYLGPCIYISSLLLYIHTQEIPIVYTRRKV